jgi:hypothetical protein
MLTKLRVIHNLTEAKEAVTQNLQMDLCSGPAAAGYAGVLWWRSLIELLRAETDWQGRGFLDCGSNAAWAVEAIHAGVIDLGFDRRSPAYGEVENLVTAAGGRLLALHA